MAPPKQRKIAIVGSRSVGMSFFLFDEKSMGWRLWFGWSGIRSKADKRHLHVGKSSLTVQFVDGHFVESYYPTIENTFSKVIKYKGQEYATEIIDTAGQVRSTYPFFLFTFLSKSRVHDRLIDLTLI
jgi:hypothetical protein